MLRTNPARHSRQEASRTAHLIHELLEDYRREDALMEASGMHDPNYKYHPTPKLLTAHEMAWINRAS
jgi:hypothetical protein